MTRSRSIVALAAAGGLALVAGGFAGTASQAAPTLTELPGLPVDGYLVLDLGTQDRFEYRQAASPDDASTTQLITQSRNKKCQVDPTAGPLAELSATGGDVGLSTDGLGVRAKNGGTNCGRIAGDGESLSITLGDELADRLISRAEVDVESKFACVLRVEWKIAGESLGTEEIPLSTSSDCGPDSGSNDNVRVPIAAPNGGADEVVFSAAEGAVSIEGGAEGAPLEASDELGLLLGTNASVFELVESDGVLDCAGTDANTFKEDGLTLTRVDPDSEDCVPIAFALSRVNDEVTFAKNLDVQPFAEFTLDLTWEPEPSSYPGRLTEIDYFDGVGFQPMDFCDGTTADPELVGDKIPSTTIDDGWCVASQSTVLVGNGQMQVTEKLYGKSDPRMR